MPRKWWQQLAPKNEWGIIASILIAALALLGPWFLLEPLFAATLPYVPVSLNVKVSLVTIAVEAVAVLIIALALMAYRKKFRDIGLDKPKILYVVQACVALCGYIVLSIVVQMVAVNFFSVNADEPQQLGYAALSGFEIALAFLPLVLLTPLAEELIFRGFMFTGIRRKAPFWVAAIAVSAFFGTMHGQWNVGLDVFVMSMVSCYLVEKTGSLWPSIILHVLKNGLAFLLVYIYNVG